MTGCELHVHSRDAEPPLTSEAHHTTPQSWQLFALNVTEHGIDHAQRVSVQVYEQIAVMARMGLARTELYDPRTVQLARTCHGNVHHWIVELMRYTSRATPGEVDALNLEAIIRHFRAQNGGVRTRVFAEACEAPRRYVAAGHSLRELMHHGLWGQA